VLADFWIQGFFDIPDTLGQSKRALLISVYLRRGALTDQVLLPRRRTKRKRRREATFIMVMIKPRAFGSAAGSHKILLGRWVTCPGQFRAGKGNELTPKVTTDRLLSAVNRVEPHLVKDKVVAIISETVDSALSANDSPARRASG
jgi:hypothetical protein